ncbi:MAG TPA: class I SAM-dependent methyltransferase [bacterium]
MKGAASTRYYRECEQLLMATFFPPLAGRLLLKTDLWDEAKNTEILCWAAERGARALGIDIAYPTVHAAKAAFDGRPLWCAAADVRHLPFSDSSVDLIYSMGTIEHFPEYTLALHELFRVLRPGGTAIIGVPNKLDPFLRPAFVYVLNRFGWYPYGMEKSFTPGELRRLLTSVGFLPTGRSGVLFMPGWLRVLDLYLHFKRPASTSATAALVRSFAWLYRRYPALRKHGYLLAMAAVKPGP